MEHRSVPARIVWTLFALTLPACGFHPNGTDNLDAWLPFRDEVPFIEPSSEKVELLWSWPNELSVHHGETCAVGRETLKVRQHLDIDRGFDRGTELLRWIRRA